MKSYKRLSSEMLSVNSLIGITLTRLISKANLLFDCPTEKAIHCINNPHETGNEVEDLTSPEATIDPFQTLKALLDTESALYFKDDAGNAREKLKEIIVLIMLPIYK